MTLARRRRRWRDDGVPLLLREWPEKKQKTKAKAKGPLSDAIAARKPMQKWFSRAILNSLHAATMTAVIGLDRTHVGLPGLVAQCAKWRPDLDADHFGLEHDAELKSPFSARRHRRAGRAVALILAGAAGAGFAAAPPQRPIRRAVYVMLEEPAPGYARINVYAQRIDRASRPARLLASETAPALNMRPGHAIDVRISPSGDRLAYRLRYAPDGQVDGRVFLVDAWGRGRTQILERAGDLHWSPDGTRIAYSVRGPEPEELPVDPIGPRWHLYDLVRGRQEQVAGAEAGLVWFGAWIRDQLVFIKPGAFFGFGQPSLVVMDPRTGRSTSRPANADLDRGDVSLRTSPTGARVVLAVSNRSSACEIFEVTRDWQLRALVATPYHRCGELQWNTDEDFFYGKESLPADGRPAPDGIAAHGYYSALSVWRYSFRSRSESEVVASDEQAVYRFQGVLPGRAIVVSRENARHSPRHVLQLRCLDGSRPVPLRASDSEVAFVGWLH